MKKRGDPPIGTVVPRPELIGPAPQGYVFIAASDVAPLSAGAVALETDDLGDAP
jgi:hypothetical protein